MSRARLDEHLTPTGMALHAQHFTPSAYESPIEERLAWAVSKLLAPGASLTPQVSLPTALTTFRADLVLHSPGRNTVLECDGREYHLDQHRDEVRDVLILHTGLADQVLRFYGADLHRVLPDVVRTIVLLHPEAFGERGQTLSWRRASPEMRETTAATLRRTTISQIGGTCAGRRRYGVARTHDLRGAFGQGRVPRQVLAGLESEQFRTFEDAVDQTRFRL